MKKLTKKEEKRIEILKDVLKHLKAERIKAKCGVIVSYEGRLPCNLEHEKNVQKVLKSMSKSKKVCKTCLRGSILFSSIWKNNKFYKEFDRNIWGDNSCLDAKTAEQDNPENQYLEKIFDKQQLAMMETAFEGEFNDSILDQDTHEKCVDFYFSSSKNPSERLKSIVKNAILNKGTFVP